VMMTNLKGGETCGSPWSERYAPSRNQSADGGDSLPAQAFPDAGRWVSARMKHSVFIKHSPEMQDATLVHAKPANRCAAKTAPSFAPRRLPARTGSSPGCWEPDMGDSAKQRSAVKGKVNANSLRLAIILERPPRRLWGLQMCYSSAP
jgi:hypothetical protein